MKALQHAAYRAQRRAMCRSFGAGLRPRRTSSAVEPHLRHGTHSIAARALPRRFIAMSRAASRATFEPETRARTAAEQPRGGNLLGSRLAARHVGRRQRTVAVGTVQHEPVPAFARQGIRHTPCPAPRRCGIRCRRWGDVPRDHRHDLDASVATSVPGQSGQPGSPFYQNLRESFGRGDYFPLVFSRGAVEKARRHRLVLTPPSR